MRVFVAILVSTAFPFSNAMAQQGPKWSVFFYGSAVRDQTTRPSTLNSACWEDKTNFGPGFMIGPARERTETSIGLEFGFLYLGEHTNTSNCTPPMQIATSVIPFKLVYLIPVGDRVTVAPKVGVSYMSVNGTFGAQSGSGHSVDPMFGLHVEVDLSREWGLRGQIERYTGSVDLFGLGTFSQRFVVASFGGVLRW